MADDPRTVYEKEMLRLAKQMCDLSKTDGHTEAEMQEFCDKLMAIANPTNEKVPELKLIATVTKCDGDKCDESWCTSKK